MLLTHRESLGSTGIGRGIALPHACVPGLKRPFALFARLKKPIDFESIDEQPADLVFLLLTPQDTPSQNVANLAAISHRLKDRAVLHELRTGTAPQKVHKALVCRLGERLKPPSRSENPWPPHSSPRPYISRPGITLDFICRKAPCWRRSF
jgi:PTS system nitrogen regulatory IIA component